MITGTHHFTIKKIEDGYLATLIDKDGHQYITWGRNEEEIFDLISDCYLTMYDVKLSWWNKLIHKLIYYGK